MPLNHTTLSLPPEARKALDARAAEAGMGRSEYVRVRLAGLEEKLSGRDKVKARLWEQALAVIEPFLLSPEEKPIEALGRLLGEREALIHAEEKRAHFRRSFDLPPDGPLPLLCCGCGKQAVLMNSLPYCAECHERHIPAAADEVEAGREAEEPSPPSAQVVDLMQARKASLAATEKPKK